VAVRRADEPLPVLSVLVRVEDADVGKCLRMLTTLAHEEIESLDAARVADAAKRDSQRRLAEKMTKLVHGDAGLSAALRATEIFYALKSPI